MDFLLLEVIKSIFNLLTKQTFSNINRATICLMMEPKGFGCQHLVTKIRIVS